MKLSTISLAILTVVGVVSFYAFPVSGHGRLWEPPARSTMWRRGFGTPVNYDDNGLNCGGFGHQVSLGYKCGTCGDPYDGVRHHEAGGVYATGTIAQTYRQGQTAVFQVELTANHLGFFEFRICPTNSPSIKATKQCLDANLLVLDNGGTKHYIDFVGPAMVNVSVHLPANLTCDFCVVQWRYHGGNNHGTDPNGTSCLGCGPQEEFYGCADVSILAGGSSTSGPSTSSPQPSASSSASTSTTTATTPIPTTSESSTTVRSTTQAPEQPTTRPTVSSSTTSGQTTSGSTTTTSSSTTSSGGGACRSHSGDPGLNQWCSINCASDYCPSHLCTCNPGPTMTCVAIGAFTGNVAMGHWCLSNCGMGNCPAHLCSCSYVPV